MRRVLFRLGLFFLLVASMSWSTANSSEEIPNYYLEGVQITGWFTPEELTEIIAVMKSMTNEPIRWITLPLDIRNKAKNLGAKERSPQEIEVYTYHSTDFLRAGSWFLLIRQGGKWQEKQRSLWKS